MNINNNSNNSILGAAAYGKSNQTGKNDSQVDAADTAQNGLSDKVTLSDEAIKIINKEALMSGTGNPEPPDRKD